MHSGNTPVPGDLRLRDHGQILVKILGCLYKRGSKLFQKLLFPFFGRHRSSFQTDPFGDQDILSRLYRSCGKDIFLLHFSHSCKRDQRLFYYLGDLCMAAHNFHVQLFAGAFHPPHHFFEFSLLGIRGKKNSQHDPQRICAGSRQVIGGYMDAVPADIFGSACYGV